MGSGEGVGCDESTGICAAIRTKVCTEIRTAYVDTIRKALLPSIVPSKTLLATPGTADAVKIPLKIMGGRILSGASG